MSTTSDEKDDKVTLIPLNERMDDLEERVQYYMRETAIYDFEQQTQRVNKVTIESFKDPEEQARWEMREIDRCRNGYRGMSGKMYFFYNYCKILKITGGKISPEYRQCDNAWFRFVEEAMESSTDGIICVKRRRVGASWKEAADVLHDCTFRPFFHVGMNSKTERDSVLLFRKVKFLYDNLPQFLRATTTAGNTAMSLDFSYYTKDEHGNRVKRGTQSNITVVAPTDTAYEGMMLNKLIIDEAGKIRNLDTIFSYAEDTMMDEVARTGTPIIFGTSGDVGKEGQGLVTMWKNSEIHRLRRFFFGGWMGMLVDEYGNDRKEEVIRWIVYERKRKEGLSAKEYNTYMQKYPLTVQEAFSQASSGGIGDFSKINRQLMSLREDPPKTSRGIFVWGDNGEPVFKPQVNGPCIVYEHPQKDKENLYLAGCDPIDQGADEAVDGESNLSLLIRKKASGIERPCIVFEYTDRPATAIDAYDQSLMALIYYNHCKVLVERQRFGMIAYFQDRGYKRLLHTAPQGIMRVIGGKVNTIGVNMTTAFINYMIELMETDINENCDLIPSEQLLIECIDYGTRNTDRVVAYGLVLALEKEDQRKVRHSEHVNRKIPAFDYKNVGGKIVRVSKRPFDPLQGAKVLRRF